MLYINVCRRLSLKRRSSLITSIQADLYRTLVDECNDRRWENPFELRNDRLCALANNMSLTTMKEARLALCELRLIGYQPGVTKKFAPMYKLYEKDSDYDEDYPLNQPPRWVADSAAIRPNPPPDWDGNSAATRPNSRPIIDVILDDENKIFVPIGTSAASAAGGKKNLRAGSKPEATDQSVAPKKEKFSAQKENDPDYHTVPHWRAIVGVWFSFNERVQHIKPSFKGRDKRCLREIMLLLEKSGTNGGKDWSEVAAVKAFTDFLNSAWQDPSFLRKKFLQKNLFDEYDAIIANQKTGAFIDKAKYSATQEQTTRTAGRPRASTVQYCPPLHISDQPVLTHHAEQEKKDLSDEDWQQMIEDDYQLTLNDKANMIFLTTPKYIFLRKAGRLRFKSREQWLENYMYAVQRSKAESTKSAIAEMRKLIYLAFLRRQAERERPSIFSQASELTTINQ